MKIKFSWSATRSSFGSPPSLRRSRIPTASAAAPEAGTSERTVASDNCCRSDRAAIPDLPSASGAELARASSSAFPADITKIMLEASRAAQEKRRLNDPGRGSAIQVPVHIETSPDRTDGIFCARLVQPPDYGDPAFVDIPNRCNQTSTSRVESNAKSIDQIPKFRSIERGIWRPLSPNNAYSANPFTSASPRPITSGTVTSSLAPEHPLFKNARIVKAINIGGS